MKKIEKLTKDDLWKMVEYWAFNEFDETEQWVIKSFSNESKVAWVVYKCNNNWSRYKDYTWVSTNYSDLSFKK